MKYFDVLLFAMCIQISFARLEVKYHWKEISYAWPSEAVKQNAIDSGQYIPENNLILGLEVWKDRLFITVPRWRSGVASSLNYIKLFGDDMSPTLIPYPSWEANTLERNGAVVILDSYGQLRNNSSIISTFRIQADECNRLWAMDIGFTDIFGDSQSIAPAALVIFDLNTDTLIRRYTLPTHVVRHNSFFVNVIVDVTKHECENAYAYIADISGNAIIVYSFKENRAWRVEHHFFHFDPLSGDFHVAGVNFRWTSGIIGLALGKPTNEGYRQVYFHALASTKEFSVPNYILQNETVATSADSYYDFSLVGDRGWNGQSITEAFHEKTNVLFYTQLNKDGVGCWNANKPYNVDTQGLVDTDSIALVFPNDLKIDRNDNLWVLSDRMSMFEFKKMKPKEYNYRILSGKINDLIMGTPCELNTFC